jgi:hypothetical protein
MCLEYYKVGLRFKMNILYNLWRLNEVKIEMFILSYRFGLRKVNTDSLTKVALLSLGDEQSQDPLMGVEPHQETVLYHGHILVWGVLRKYNPDETGVHGIRYLQPTARGSRFLVSKPVTF